MTEVMRSNEGTCEVLVVGGGPAGSTIAALLASDGIDVLLLEKDRHPRFHIGESLLPLNMPLFDRLGVREEIDKIGMPKYGIEFTSPWHDKVTEFEFSRALDKEQPASAYQVRRSEFDQVLLKNAAAKGAKVVEGCRVNDVMFLPDGGACAVAQHDDGAQWTYKAKFLVDASGRDTLLANRFGFKRTNLRHNSAAVFGHFTGARRLPGRKEGYISIFWFDHGWFWFIPLADGTTSVGAVCRPDYINARTTEPTQFFFDTIALCPAIQARLTAATLLGPATITGNYSYKADRMTGQSYIMLGDAFAFIDPVFSTGVYLAMTSAFQGADVVKTCLATPAQAAHAMKRFDTTMRRGLDIFSWYIYRVTRPALRDMFMNPHNIFRIEEAMLSLLAGDVFRPSFLHARLLLFRFVFYLKTLGYKLRGSEPWTLSRHATGRLS